MKNILNSGTEIYNYNHGITYEIEETKGYYIGDRFFEDVRINVLENGVWVNQYDGGWAMAKAREKLFELRTGMLKANYRHMYGSYQTLKAQK